MMRSATEITWARTGWLHRWVDYATLLIACCWVALLMLWPDMPQTDAAVVPRRLGIVVAQDAGLPSSQTYRRPDLFAFSSDRSFVSAGEGEALSVGVDYARTGGAHVLPRPRHDDGVRKPSSMVAMAAEAIREVGGHRSPALYAPWDLPARVASSPVSVSVSAGLGDATLVWSEADQLQFFGVEHAWEVELSLSITEDGQPVSVFLETSCGDAAMDRAIVAAVSRPDHWRDLSPGHGTVLISFSPNARNGVLDED
ncbi:MAG: energy transducer TonB [Verrucomicrobia bacterium]|jgi:hypothetical protein|nr:energy transducer TonB [Verrucomicrobiota bacterium]